jgi:hypothetical protein
VEQLERSQRIAALNDQLRRGVGLLTAEQQISQGLVLMTPGVNALSEAQKLTLWQRVRDFDQFTPDNDPFGEHDFGIIRLDGVGSVYWKIDYYDPGMVYGSEDPADPAATLRVLTVLLASEY